jgi:Icc-related predicted phosphoesterase
VRVQLISDVHAEFHRDGGVSFCQELEKHSEGVDVLVVAGDLATVVLLYENLVMLCHLYPDVVYVTGNHEYYGSTRYSVHHRIEEAKSKLPNLHWLHSDVVEIGGHRFLGTTLWFPDDPMNPVHEHRLNDFYQIQGFRDWVYEENERAVRFLKDEIRGGEIVVTHHLPSYALVDSYFQGSDLNRFFVTELGQLITYGGPALWFFGHTHSSVDRLLGVTRVVCNPFGYARHSENPDFEWGKTIEV